MAHTSIYAIIGLKTEKIIPKNKYFLTSIIIGIILPDIDFILQHICDVLKILGIPTLIVSNSIFHSIFMLPLISLLILIYAEIKQKKELKVVATGIAIGMALHIIIDIITFQSVGVFYPLIVFEFK